MSSGVAILIVEDEVPIAMRLQSALISMGFNVPDFACSREEALRLAEEMQPSLALVDIRLLPDDDGVAVAKELRERFGVRCVFVTVDDSLSTFHRSLDACPLDYLRKPVSDEALLEAVRWALMDLGNLIDVINGVVPDAQRWIDTPNVRLNGLTPLRSIGTREELELRRLIRAYIQGMPT